MTTHTFLLLDMTGSMAKIKMQTIDAYNEYIDSLRDDPHTGDFVMSIGVFNSNIGLERVAVAQPVKQIPGLNEERYQPAGSTPLYDAIGDGIVAVQDHQDLHGLNSVLFIIQTDGEENCSQRYKKQDIVELIAKKTTIGWQFVYLGCDIDAMSAGEALGIDPGQTLSYTGSQSVAAMRAVSKSTRYFADTGSLPTVDFFSEKDKLVDDSK